MNGFGGIQSLHWRGLVSHAVDAVDALGGMFSDENRYVRGDTVHALYRIGTPEAKEVLLQFLMRTRWCPLTSRESTH